MYRARDVRLGREVPLRKASVAHVSWTPAGGGALEALYPADVLVRLGAA